MANLSQLTLPVKDTITGQVTQQTFNLSGGGGSDTANFVGTLAQWEALTQAEKNQYDFVDLTDDYYDIDEELQTMADNLYAKQDKTDNNLETTSKTVVGAINEVKDSVGAVGNQLIVTNNQLIVNNTKFYFDSHDGEFGYNTSPNRGADTFVPFNKYHTGSFNPINGTLTVDMGFTPSEFISAFGLRSDGDARACSAIKNSSNVWKIASSSSGWMITGVSGSTFSFKWDSTTSLPTVYWIAK